MKGHFYAQSFLLPFIMQEKWLDQKIGCNNNKKSSQNLVCHFPYWNIDDGLDWGCSNNPKEYIICEGLIRQRYDKLNFSHYISKIHITSRQSHDATLALTISFNKERRVNGRLLNWCTAFPIKYEYRTQITNSS